MSRRISRRRLAEYVADGLDKDHGQSINQLAAYLVETRRTKEASLIVRDVEDILAERGTVIGSVSSVNTLSNSILSSIEKFIVSQTKADRVLLKTAIDEELIGGFRVRLPGYEIDQSIKKRLTNLRAGLKQV